MARKAVWIVLYLAAWLAFAVPVWAAIAFFLLLA